MKESREEKLTILLGGWGVVTPDCDELQAFVDLYGVQDRRPIVHPVNFGIWISINISVSVLI